MSDKLPQGSNLVNRVIQNRFIVSAIEESKRLTDMMVNGRSIGMFERILLNIISENRVDHYSGESYYEKIKLLQQQRRERGDIEDIKLITNKIGLTYKVSGYDIGFDRIELDAIGEKYTELTVY